MYLLIFRQLRFRTEKPMLKIYLVVKVSAMLRYVYCFLLFFYFVYCVYDVVVKFTFAISHPWWGSCFNFPIQMENKMLSYRRETAMQCAL